MFKNIKGQLMEGAKDGLTLYGAQTAFSVADGIVKGLTTDPITLKPSIPEFIRRPAVGLILAMVLQKVVGGKVGKLATTVAFAETIATWADPYVAKAVHSFIATPQGPVNAPTTQGYVTKGYANTRGIGSRDGNMRGYTQVNG